MNGIRTELKIAFEVLMRWETIAALVGFILLWSLFRYIALVRRKPAGFRFGFPRRRAPAPPPAPEPAAGEGEENTSEEE